MNNEKLIPVMAIRLPETNEFSQRFNYVGRLWDKANDETLSEAERKEWENEYSAAKLCLEQGYPIGYRKDV